MPLAGCGPLGMGRRGLSKNAISRDRIRGHWRRGMAAVRRLKTTFYTPHNRFAGP